MGTFDLKSILIFFYNVHVSGLFVLIFLSRQIIVLVYFETLAHAHL